MHHLKQIRQQQKRKRNNMWKTIEAKTSSGAKKFQYKLICDECHKPFKRDRIDLVVDTIRPLNYTSSYWKGWDVYSNGHALCPKCNEKYRLDELVEDSENRYKDLISFETWKKRNNPVLINERKKNTKYLENVVWPTLRNAGFKIYILRSPITLKHRPPKVQAEGILSNIGLPDGIFIWPKAEFVYYREWESRTLDIDNVSIFWREKK